MPKENFLKHFQSFIGHVDGGALAEELTDKMREVIQQIADHCFEHGGTHKGSLVLKLDFKMDQKDRYVEVNADVKQTLPKTPRGRAAIYFTDSEGNLTREDPRQITIEDELERQRKAKEAMAEQMYQQN